MQALELGGLGPPSQLCLSPRPLGRKETMVMSLHFRVMVKIGQCHIYAAVKYILDAESVVKLF